MEANRIWEVVKDIAGGTESTQKSWIGQLTPQPEEKGG